MPEKKADTKFQHIKVYFRRPDTGAEQEAGIILLGEFGSGFAYHDKYDGPPLDPVHLDYRRVGRRFQLGTESTQRGSTVHGVFEDVLPDGFAHEMLKHDVPEYGRMTDVERMFWLGSRTHGPFRFQAMESIGKESPITGEKQLEAVRKKMVAFHLDPDAFEGPVTNKFTRWALTHDGGSQPKCLFEHTQVTAGQGGARVHQKTRYVAKFNVDRRRSNFENTAKVEASMLDMSAACGISTPAARVLHLKPSNEDVLLVRRFDEAETDKGLTPLHRVSFVTLTGIDNVGRTRARAADFSDVLQAIKEVSSNAAEDTEELFRRMMFHVAINNVDNHLKNFEMLLTKDGWRLAPSFDTLPDGHHPGTNAFSTTVCGEAFPKLNNEFIEKAGRQFGLTKRRALELSLQVVEGCCQITHHLDHHGVNQIDRERVMRSVNLTHLNKLRTGLRNSLQHAALAELMPPEPDSPLRAIGG